MLLEMINFKKKIMVSELKEVISTIKQLKDEEQRQLAKMLTDEINWDLTFKNSKKELEKLAQEALNEYKKGDAQQIDW